jgi:hypothetical protein
MSAVEDPHLCAKSFLPKINGRARGRMFGNRNIELNAGGGQHNWATDSYWLRRRQGSGCMY